MFVQRGAFIVLLCQVCGESRDIVLSASPWNVLSGCRMNNLHKAIVVSRVWIDVTYMRVSKYIAKASQLAFLKLMRRRKGVGVCVTAALIRMAIVRCWVCGIGSRTYLLPIDAMLLLTKERSGLYPRFQRLLLNEQGSFGSCIKLKWCASDHSSTRSPFSSVLLYPQVVLWLLKSPMTTLVL